MLRIVGLCPPGEVCKKFQQRVEVPIPQGDLHSGAYTYVGAELLSRQAVKHGVNGNFTPK